MAERRGTSTDPRTDPGEQHQIVSQSTYTGKSEDLETGKKIK